MSTTLPVLPPEGRRDYLAEHPFEVVMSPLPDGVLVEQAQIEMRDGVLLAATVFRPADDRAHPVIATATPYGKDRYDQWDTFQDAPVGSVPGGGFYMGRVEISDHTAFEAPDPGWWVPRGYAVVLIDLPGRGGSTSNPEGSPGPEARWHDAMAWLGEQPWSTGNVGMSGVSALCATQWIAAKQAPPQLKAIIAWEGFNATGPGNGYGGIPETAFPGWLVSQWLIPSLNPDADGPEAELFAWAYDTSQITVPALVCASFSDQELHTWDTFDAFLQMRSEHKWLYGHRRQKWGAFYGEAELAVQKRFLDRFLCGDAHAMDDVAPVRLEINESRHDFRVLETTTWPIPGTVHRSLHLDAATAALSDGVPAASSCAFAPAPVADEENRAVFDLRFDTDTDLVGDMALELWIEPCDTDDVDLFVGIEKLDANGDERYFFSASGGNANGPVMRGWLRASHRALDTARSQPQRPVLARTGPTPLPAGEVTLVSVPLMPSGTTFRAGETLRVVVQSWSTPGQWEGGETREWHTHTAGHCRLHTGSEHPSRLIVPVVEGEVSPA